MNDDDDDAQISPAAAVEELRACPSLLPIPALPNPIYRLARDEGLLFFFFITLEPRVE